MHLVVCLSISWPSCWPSSCGRSFLSLTQQACKSIVEYCVVLWNNKLFSLWTVCSRAIYTVCYLGYYMYIYSKNSERHAWASIVEAGPEVIKPFSCSTQLSMKFVLLINLNLLIIANSFLLNIAEHENFSANKYENVNYCWHFHIY